MSTNLEKLLVSPVTGAKPPVLEGQQQLLVRMREFRTLYDRIKESIKELRDELLAKAGDLRAFQEAKGKPCLRVDVVDVDGTLVPISWPASFRPVKEEAAEPLRTELGEEDFLSLFREEDRFKLDVELHVLESAIESGSLSTILTLGTFISQVVPVDGFDGRRASLLARRPELGGLFQAMESRRLAPKVRLG